MPGDPLVQELVGALRALLDAVKANPAMQRREYVSLGIQVNNALSRAEAALDEGSGGGWRDMADAPRRRPVLLKMRADLQAFTGRADLERWEGRYVVCSWQGQVSGWGIAAPVGVGGFPDEWFVGWREVEPEAPPPPLPEGEG